MKFKINGNKIIAYNLKQQEIINLLKVQIGMHIVFYGGTKDNKVQVGKTLCLYDRIVENNVQKINMSYYGEKWEVKTYEEILTIIGTNLSKYYCEIEFSKSDFKNKEPLIEIIGNIREEIINGCVLLDYTDGVFTLINKKKNKLPNEMYYWEETSSLFIFGENGPSINFESDYDNIEKILC